MSSFQINNFSLATYGAIGLTSVVLALITVYDNYLPEGAEAPPPPGTDSAAIFNSLMPASVGSIVGSMLGTTSKEPEKEEPDTSPSFFGSEKEESASPSFLGSETEESTNVGSEKVESTTPSLFGNNESDVSASAPPLFGTTSSETSEPSLVGTTEQEESIQGGKKRKAKVNKSTKKKR